MKKIITLMAAVTLMGTSVFAQFPSRLTVFSEDGNPFYLVVNGIKQNDKPLTNVLVDGLSMPNYKVKVLFEDAQLPAIDKMLMVHDADDHPSEVAYRIKKNNKGVLVLQYFSSKPVAQPMVYSANTVPADMAVVNFRSSETVNNTVYTGSSVTTTTTTVGAPGGVGVYVDVVDPVTGERVGVNAGIGINMGGGTVTSTTTTTTTSSSSTGGYVNNTPPPVSQGCMYPMASRDFESAKGTIRGQSFEETKLSSARNIASSNCLSPQQVKEICNLFSFEESKLDFAKFAYTRCTERNNYFIVSDVFSFSSSTEDLNKYISSVR